ncbi:hypothetical protein [Kitasatospora sp. MBT63]|uniref:hypothetical protein n=1 Tax=Kitasatospora sp. MBT63 TaxID=1444768 RepID=UPI00053BBA04|nr:hypothetical protein [Kitasatospora sp. MBT63]
MTPSLLTEENLRLLETAQPYCLRHALALAGTEALHAHGLPAGRPTGLVLITAEGPPLSELAVGLAETLRAAGHTVREEPGTPRRIQLTAASGPIELRREPLRHPPLLLDAPVPVIALPDAAGLAVLDLCDRALPADLRAVHALADRFRPGELLALAAALDEDFQPAVLADRLEAAAELSGPGHPQTQVWAQLWAQDLRLDLMETLELPDGLHDPYLEETDQAETDPAADGPQERDPDDL